MVMAFGTDGEGLHLDDDRALALHRRHDRRARDPGAAVGQEQRRRVRDAVQPGRRHLEQTEFVRRAEAVLGRAEQPECVMTVALELQHGVDDVFEHPRAGEEHGADGGNEYERQEHPHDGAAGLAASAERAAPAGGA